MYNNSPKHIENLNKARTVGLQKIECIFCNKGYTKFNITRHQQACPKNPDNLIECLSCKKSFVPKYKGTTTCSYACSNTYYQSGTQNGNWKEDSYRTTCFHHHKKECVVCGEDKIVTVHHMNENHKDNRPENLIPLCPTHHQYFHSRYRNLVEPTILTYLENWKKQL